jgi:hypothetical protein
MQQFYEKHPPAGVANGKCRLATANSCSILPANQTPCEYKRVLHCSNALIGRDQETSGGNTVEDQPA